MYPSPKFISKVLVLVAAAVILNDEAMAMINPLCVRCDTVEECDKDPTEVCVFGENRNPCNRRVCSKGPGESCGAAFNVLGTCGEGLWCSHKDNRCHGCYIPTMQCYPLE